MNKNKKNIEFNTLGALYSYVMMEMDTYINTLKTLEENLAKADNDLYAIMVSSKKINGLEHYVEELLMGKYYQAKNFIFVVRKKVKNYAKRLEVFFVHNYDKKAMFDEKLEELAILAKEREFYVDGQIEKCIDFIGEYQKL